MLLLYNFSITTNITIFTQNEGILHNFVILTTYGRKNLNYRK